ncbi:unnamed protein product [Chondrus crispus]|uniref:Uncharacterized protein n=1 Tax=Chondrus crispus TaxID=2769 RepID=R7Q4Q0_CHOCR|nr:unnamed protein product [Chondrus crispus]CDF33497.1 unnamed protein product [Chondrus crispus]|eukprot:XP_005713300.1 unnamed protein product [Chondrus crispus]
MTVLISCARPPSLLVPFLFPKNTSSWLKVPSRAYSPLLQDTRRISAFLAFCANVSKRR